MGIIFVSQSDYKGPILNLKNSDIQIAIGTISSRANTRGIKSKGDWHEYKYTFNTEGEVYSGKSYSSKLLNISQEVKVEFLPNYPQISRIEGMNTAHIPAWGFVTGLFFVLAVKMLIDHFKRINGQISLLKQGRITEGIFLKVINPRPRRPNIYFNRMRSRQFRGVYFVSERRSPQPDSRSYQGEEVMKCRSKRRPVKV